MCTNYTFDKYVKPIIAALAASMHYIQYDQRLDWNNHCEVFPSLYTTLVDTFPVNVAVAERDTESLLYQPKYQHACFKVEIEVGFRGNIVFYSTRRPGTLLDWQWLVFFFEITVKT